jgi:16S rRNA (cytosine1402-N4)-methyltransferase
MVSDEINTDEQMSMAGGHMPVMLEEAIDLLNVRPEHFYVDATAGAGGHLKRICQKAGSGKGIIAIDQDFLALNKLSANSGSLAKEVKFVHANFANLNTVLSDLDIHTIDGGILADLGVSSNQLDDSQRGFSFQREGPLDMRMDASSQGTAADLVNDLNEVQLANIIYKYGEERNSRAIARAIIKNRPFTSTGELSDVVGKVVRYKGHKSKMHPATRTFQALRIAVNNELENLEIFLQQAVSLLAPGARLVIITFHSLEDRIVKRFFTHMASPCICPPRQPICTCNKKKELLIITPKPLIAGEEEILTNIRSRSAKLRAAEKLP